MMNYGTLSLLLGLLPLPASCGYPLGSCDGYKNITEPWRNRGFTSTSFPGYPKDDSHLILTWLRFTGIGGDRVVPSCIGNSLGGTEHVLYVPFEYPTNESETEVTGTAFSKGFWGCTEFKVEVSVAYCPGGFFVYKRSFHLLTSMAFVIYHSNCGIDSCGPLAECAPEGGCVCQKGYQIPPTHLPTADSYGCADTDECLDTAICGDYSTCTNTVGGFLCSCIDGYNATGPKLTPAGFLACTDIDECLEDVCANNGTCTNSAGSFECECIEGYKADMDFRPVCQDIDECYNSTVCGPESKCTNTPGSYFCSCDTGYAATEREEDPSDLNICIDISECTEEPTICGPHSNCTNTVGSYTCTCHKGYRLNNLDVIASARNPCTDIDECFEQPGICGLNTVCTNVPGTFFCSCPDGLFPSTGIFWIVGTSFCQNLDDVIGKIVPKQGETKERAFLGNMDEELRNNSDAFLPDATVTNFWSATMEVSGVGPRAKEVKVSSEGDGNTGSFILEISDRLVTTMLHSYQNTTKKSLQTKTVDLSLHTINPESQEESNVALSAKGQTLDMNLQALASANNGSASVVFMTLDGMESLLSHQYFRSENKTEMNSDVFTVILPSVNNTNLTEPVNFTIQHKKKIPDNGIVTCVYWQDINDKEGTGHTMQWSVDGCWVSFSHENYTVCSCSHLSTFALILQISEPPPSDPFLEWLNRMCVIVGLFFFGLAIFTFLLCSWNPKINNTARLHLCLNLALSHLLLLWNDQYLDSELACTVMAGLLHFLVVAGFVWMLLEALQLHLLVRRLSKVQVIQRDGLPRPLLYVIGYGVPFTVVGVSALVFSDGYGATEAKACWLTVKRNFNWALTGPVIVVLALNWILFCATLWSLRPTLANMKSDVSQSKDTRLILFKIVAQFVILGCTWILGLYQTNLFFQVLFILLNSQQGTFLFIVHCLLNKEVREEYIRWLTCSYRKDFAMKDAPSVTEDFDKTDN